MQGPNLISQTPKYVQTNIEGQQNEQDLNLKNEGETLINSQNININQQPNLNTQGVYNMQGYIYDPNQIIQMSQIGQIGQLNQMNTVYPYVNYNQPYIDYSVQDPNKQDTQGNIYNQMESNVNYGNSSTKS